MAYRGMLGRPKAWVHGYHRAHQAQRAGRSIPTTMETDLLARWAEKKSWMGPFTRPAERAIRPAGPFGPEIKNAASSEGTTNVPSSVHRIILNETYAEAVLNTQLPDDRNLPSFSSFRAVRGSSFCESEYSLQAAVFDLKSSLKPVLQHLAADH